MNLNEIKTKGMRILKQQTVTMIQTQTGVSVQSLAFSAETKAILIRAQGGDRTTHAHFDIGTNPVASGSSFFIIPFNPYNNGTGEAPFFINVNPGDKLAGLGPAFGGNDLFIHILELGY